MTLSEITELARNPDIRFPVSITSFNLRGDKLVINDKIAIPIIKYASYFKTGVDISIFNKSGIEVGSLIFTTELGEVNINSLTEDRFIAFLNESEQSSYGFPYRFSKNYVVLFSSFYDEYVEKHMNFSSLWGGFCHPNTTVPISSYLVEVPRIVLRELDFSSDIFLENSIRAVSQPYAFERFLKLYHLLELLFDFDVINRIKKLNVETDPEKIGELLNDYSSKEIKRLEDILETYCQDLTPLVSALNNASTFVDLAFDLFYKFGTGKEGNPFNGQESKLKNVLATGFDESNLKILKINFQGSYRKFILKVTGYFIYRTRSSIAHNKIGEFILSMKNEDFLVEFAEPLLKEVLIQCFKKA